MSTLAIGTTTGAEQSLARDWETGWGEDSSAAIGIDLGGTTIKAVAMDPAGTILTQRTVPTNARDGRDALLTSLTEVVDTLRRDLAVDRPVTGVGISVPGVVDAPNGIVEFTVALTPEWTGFAAAPVLTRLTGLPFALLNDAQAATLAEHTWGGGRGCRDLVCVTVGTGIGGGLVLNDRLYPGSRGMSGVIGHTTVEPDGLACGCGNRGCLETVASGTAIVRAAREAGLQPADGSTPLTPRFVAEAALAGSAPARRVYEHAGSALGIALANVVCLLNPSAIVVGGGVSRAGNLLLDPLQREIAVRTTVFSPERGGVEVIPSPLGDIAGAMGSAAWSMQTGEPPRA